MAIERERKFLVVGTEWREQAQGVPIRQGYLSLCPERIVRVRTVGDTAVLTVKGITEGYSRLEFEYAIPFADAEIMLSKLIEGALVEKIRYLVYYEGYAWEIDEFSGQNAGLIVAEVEFLSIDEAIPLPPWVGREVTADPRYFNSNLIDHPFSRW